ncbi:hypothetical protein M426DRAFT_113088 [Hypoxylon sp. CI-4A]|nr:hypothetical protein M426DRAFT_113088 [Hypoxylon sp. CI-4A]
MDRFNDFVDYILNVTGYVIAWVNDTAKGVVQRLFGLNPVFVYETDQEVNPDGQPETNADFVKNVNEFFQNTPAERFFKDNPKFIAELAEKASALAEDPSTPICCEDLLPKTVQVTMHQQVLYCDDSGSMRHPNNSGDRWNSQNQLINRIARITTRILPEGEGVYLRYINRDVPNSDSLKFEELPDILKQMRWDGDTPIGTNLKKKILQPLVYSKLPNNLKRPLLISVITDGGPSKRLEDKNTFADAIIECGDRLEACGLPRESVKFLVGQVGDSQEAVAFLKSITDEPRIASMVFVASERLDDGVNSRLTNDWDMDKWVSTYDLVPVPV